MITWRPANIIKHKRTNETEAHDMKKTQNSETYYSEILELLDRANNAQLRMIYHFIRSLLNGVQ